MHWFVNKYVIGGILALVIICGAYFKGYYKGKSLVQAEWDKVVAEQTLKSVSVERSMQQKVDSVVEEKNREIARIKRSHAALVAGLQHRTQRPESELPASTETPQNCSGAGLYREDGEFLAGEASRADQYALELLSCYKAYDEVFNAFKNN